VIVLALSLLLGLQPITTDLYLPTLPLLQKGLGVSPADAQWTLSLLLLAFGFSQLIVGPLADRWGRQPVLRWGLSLFVLASLLTCVAESITLMVLARSAQGACLAATVVCGRAMIRDLYPPHEGARVMASGMAGLGLLALIGPIVGGLIASHGHWRMALGVVALTGLLTLAFVVFKLPETLSEHRRTSSIRVGQLLRDWFVIAQHPTFRAHTLLTAATYGGLFVCLAVSSFVFASPLGHQGQTYGLMMATVSLAYLTGTQLCSRLLPRVGLIGTVRIGGYLTLSSGVWLAGLSLAVAWTDWQASAVWILPGLWLYVGGHGIHQPCGQTGVVSAFPRHAGAATALSGFLLALTAFAAGALLSALMKLPALADSIHPLTLGMAIGAACTAWAALHVVQRDGLAPAVSTP